MRKFFFALEAEDVETPPVDASDVIESTSEVEEAHDEVETKAEEVEDLGENVEKGVDATDTLTTLGDTMTEKVADGDGLSEDAAKIAEIVIESIRNDLNMPKKIGKIPSMESFKSPRTRLEATKIALEAVDLSLKSIWENILRILKAISAKLKAYLAGLMKNYDGMLKHLENLKGMANASKGEMEKEALEKESLANFFSVEGKADVTTAVKTLNSVSSFGAILKKIMTFISGKVDLQKISTMDKAAAEKAVKDHFDEFIRLLEFKVATKNVKDGESAFKSGPFPGNKWLRYELKDGNFSIDFIDGKEGAKTIKALNKNEILSLLDEASTVAKGGKEMKENADLVDKTIKAVMTASEKVSAEIAKTSEKGKGEAIREASKVASNYTKIVSKFGNKLPSMHFASVKYSADYVAASIANFKKEEKKEKGDEGKQ